MEREEGFSFVLKPRSVAQYCNSVIHLTAHILAQIEVSVNYLLLGLVCCKLKIINNQQVKIVLIASRLNRQNNYILS